MIDGSTQQVAADRCGISQPRWSELERGLGRNAAVETWAVAAASVGLQLAAFLEGMPGADRPRDIEHLRRQSALVAFSEPGGWRSLPELALEQTPRSRSVDVALVRWTAREAVVGEIWDWFDDVGAAFRSLDAKKLLLFEWLQREQLGDAPWRVRGLFIVRATRRNRLLLRELAALFAAKFPGRSRDWLAALTDRAQPMPASDGVVWSNARGDLRAARFSTR